MVYADTKKRYINGLALTEQKNEDLIARRVLSGIGFKTKNLADIEKALEIKTDYSEALWPRVKTVLKETAIRTGGLPRILFGGSNVSSPRFDLIVKDSDNVHNDSIINDLLELKQNNLKWDKPDPCYLIRINGTTNAIAYYFVYSESVNCTNMISIVPNIYNITPPFHVLSKTNNDAYFLIAQCVELFIKQFGPYKLNFYE